MRSWTWLWILAAAVIWPGVSSDCESAGSTCSDCLAAGGPTCGWCNEGRACISGGRIGPSGSASCAWQWYYEYCPNTPSDPCVAYSDCYNCILNGRPDPFSGHAPCGWCASTSECLSGYMTGPATGRCTSTWVWAQFDQPSNCPATTATGTATMTAASTSTATWSATVTATATSTASTGSSATSTGTSTSISTSTNTSTTSPSLSPTNSSQATPDNNRGGPATGCPDGQVCVTGGSLSAAIIFPMLLLVMLAFWVGRWWGARSNSSRSKGAAGPIPIVVPSPARGLAEAYHSLYASTSMASLSTGTDAGLSAQRVQGSGSHRAAVVAAMSGRTPDARLPMDASVLAAAHQQNTPAQPMLSVNGSTGGINASGTET